MRIHKTRYATLTNDELLKEADRQGFNVSELGLEFMERVLYMQDQLEQAEKKGTALDP